MSDLKYRTNDELVAEIEQLRAANARMLADCKNAGNALGEIEAENERLSKEVTAWKAFARHCQRIVAAVKSHLTAEQAVEFLNGQIDDGIRRLASSDTYDVDPELLEYAERVLGLK